MKNKDEYTYDTPIFDCIRIKNDTYDELIAEEEYLNDVIERFVPLEVRKMISLSDAYKSTIQKQAEYKILKAFILGVKIGKNS